MVTTVNLDVGGTKYRVSKSLIAQYPNTMLARLISDTWNNQEEQEEKVLFIDRNGQRFQYVLDYMRDTKVHLPVGVTNGSFLQELEYFGFQDIPSGAVESACANFEAAKHVSSLYKETDVAFNNMTENLFLEKLALMVYEHFVKHGIGYLHTYHSYHVEKSHVEKSQVMLSGWASNKAKLDNFNKILAKYGLKCCYVRNSYDTGIYASFEPLVKK